MFAEALALVGHLPVRSSSDRSSIKVNAASLGSFLQVSTRRVSWKISATQVAMASSPVAA
jgi:hypothetical protein